MKHQSLFGNCSNVTHFNAVTVVYWLDYKIVRVHVFVTPAFILKSLDFLLTG
jgi:hypothetical protein